jgi:hypothetical protein
MPPTNSTPMAVTNSTTVAPKSGCSISSMPAAVTTTSGNSRPLKPDSSASRRRAT